VVGRRSSQLQLTQLIKTALINLFCIRNLIFIVNENSARQRNKNTFHRNCATTERLIPGAFWGRYTRLTHKYTFVHEHPCCPLYNRPTSYSTVFSLQRPSVMLQRDNKDWTR
jgi:hypothetical protein